MKSQRSTTVSNQSKPTPKLAVFAMSRGKQHIHKYRSVAPCVIFRWPHGGMDAVETAVPYSDASKEVQDVFSQCMLLRLIDGATEAVVMFQGKQKMMMVDRQALMVAYENNKGDIRMWRSWIIPAAGGRKLKALEWIELPEDMIGVRLTPYFQSAARALERKAKGLLK